MPPKEQTVVCPECLKPFTAVPKITFNGFQKYNCPHCRKIVYYPLARKAIYWIIPVIVVFIFFFAIISLLEIEGGEPLLIFFAELPIWINEYKSFILWPLFLWSLVRLGGMYSKKVLEVSRKILYATGILALLAVLLALLGFIAGVMRIGIVLPPLVGAFFLLAFYLYGLRREASIRKKIQGIPR
jgi:hypothetical protein